MQLELDFIDDTFHGPYRRFYESGQLNVDSYYSYGKLDGCYISYFDDGKLKNQTQYKNSIEFCNFYWFH